MTLSGVAEVCEWFDDRSQLFRIDVHVSNRRWGPLFGYTGSFEVEWRERADPTHLLPKRTEARE